MFHFVLIRRYFQSHDRGHYHCAFVSKNPLFSLQIKGEGAYMEQSNPGALALIEALLTHGIFNKLHLSGQVMALLVLEHRPI